uniref:Uncharacterized protein n=1 Tax=Arundo donax TaxID=35708 RepID=A0A0A8YTI2_ARUDO
MVHLIPPTKHKLGPSHPRKQGSTHPILLCLLTKHTLKL